MNLLNFMNVYILQTIKKDNLLVIHNTIIVYLFKKTIFTN